MKRAILLTIGFTGSIPVGVRATFWLAADVVAAEAAAVAEAAVVAAAVDIAAAAAVRVAAVGYSGGGGGY